MAMTAGTVTVSAAGVVSKSGMAEAIFDALILQATSDYGDVGAPFPPSDPVALVKLYKGIAKAANPLASAIVTYITANAKAQILTTDSALQRTPNPNNVDTATQGPSATKLLAIV